VFYTVPGLDNTEFRYIKPDGTGDTSFATLPSNVAAVGLNAGVASRLVFAHRDNNAAKYGIYRNATVNMTGATTLVAPAYDFVSSLQVSSNGEFVYYVGTTGNVDALYKLPINGGAPTTLVTSGVFSAHVSLAGDRVAFSQIQSNNRGAIFVRSTANVDVPVQLTDFEGTDGFDADYPQFSKDGARIVFSSNRLSTITFDLWTVPSVGGNFQRLTNTPDADEIGASFNGTGTMVSFVAIDIDSEKTGIWRTSSTTVGGGRTALRLSSSVGSSTYWTTANGRASRGADLRLDQRRRRLLR
jgi:Tol biopolymer transport system component